MVPKFSFLPQSLKKIICLSVFLFLMGITHGAHAASFLVTSLGDGGDANWGDNLCDNGAGVCTLRAAVEESNANGDIENTIHFHLPVHSQITLGSELHPTKSLQINGPGLQNLTISGNHATRIFEFSSATHNQIFSLNGLTLADGKASNTGGSAVYVFSNTLTLSDCLLKNNQAVSQAGDQGGAIVNFGAFVQILNTTFSENSAAGNGGGAIYTSNSGAFIANVVIQNSTFRQNQTSGSGGAILNSDGHLKIENSTFSGNHSDQNGGALAAQNGQVELANVTLAFNQADFDGNNDGDGGGIFQANASVQLVNTIVAKNQDKTSFGGVVENDCHGSLTTVGHNLLGDETGCSGLVNGANGDKVGSGGAPLDPLLADLADNSGVTQTHALLAGSPAFNAGDDSKLPVSGKDQRGFLRGSGSDIGAFEAVCGDGLVQDFNAESCDDQNGADGDGCSATCKIEAGFTCSGSPSVCVPIVCGDGKCEAGETSATCAQDCPATCGNGVCESGEDASNCPQDCPAPPAPGGSSGGCMLNAATSLGNSGVTSMTGMLLGVLGLGYFRSRRK